jgi:hypothetical protein
MSTLHIRPTHPALWWYAAAAVLAGAVLALIIATLQSTSPGVVTQTGGHPVDQKGRFGSNPYTCLAHHPVPNIELPTCVSPVR